MQEMNALDRLREMCEAATPGPWEIKSHGNWSIAVHGQDTALFIPSIAHSQRERNFSFIATARAAMPALIELVEALAWKDTCKAHYAAITHERIDARLDAAWRAAVANSLTSLEAATAAVQAAREKLEEVCPTAP